MPGLNINKSQKSYLNTIHLDQIGTDKGSVAAFELSEIDEVLLSLAALFKVSAENNLEASHSHSSGALTESIQFDKVKLMGGVYTLEIEVLEYFKFVNSGVNGLKVDHGSPYSFRNMGVSKSMLKSIRKWVIREGLKVRVKEALSHPIGAENKGKPFSGVKGDEATQTAFVVSKGIKRNGLKPTFFWDKAAKTTAEAIKKGGFGAALAPIIVNELRRK
jgi:hypothetical protein